MAGRVALVTGGTRGIGAAISKMLKLRGYQVAANYAGNDVAASAFKEETGVPVYKFDVSDFDAVKTAVAKIESDLGPIEIVVNNAGITRDSTMRRLDRGMWDAVIDSSIANVSEKLEEEPQLNEAAAAALNSFIRMARLQFLRVDKTVLAQCTQIGKLREPIEKLLEEGKGNAG